MSRLARSLVVTLLPALACATPEDPPGEPAPRQAPELFVAADGSGDHTTIQAAVEAAPPGARIHVAPGTYAERVSIEKPLMLIGAGWEQTVLTAPYEPPASQGELPSPTLRVKGADGVTVSGIEILQPGDRHEGRVSPGAAVVIEDAGVLLEDCAVLGSPASGVMISGRSGATVRGCLVAGVGATGIAVVGPSGEDLPEVVIEDCDVRNCLHRGITIARAHGVRVERCRISGSSWHGIRYDHASPSIRDNLIHDNARSGIYASGTTRAQVTGNVFFRNRMTGMSCWFRNSDRIQGNTFAGNLRSGVEVLGASTPTLEGNTFVDEVQAVALGNIGGEDADSTSTGEVDLKDSVFWRVERELVVAGESRSVAGTDGNWLQDPGFEPPSLESPWPPQPEERTTGIASPEEDRAAARDQDLRAQAWKRAEPWIEDILQIRDRAARDAAVEELRAALRSPDPLERHAALVAFIRTAEATYDRSTFRPLVRPLVDTETGEARVQALFALLGSERKEGDCQLVVDLLEDDPSTALRESGSLLLANACERDLTGAAASAAALELLATENRAGLREVMRGLWGVSASDALQARLREIASGPSRHDAIYFGLSTLRNKDRQTTAVLIEALEDPDFNVSGRALWGLTHGVAEEARPLAADAALTLFEARAHARDECVRILRDCADASHLEAMRALADNELLSDALRADLRGAIDSVERRG